MTQDITKTDDTVVTGVGQEEVVKNDTVILPEVSFDDNDIPITANSSVCLEEEIWKEGPEATASLCHVSCDNCGRKFNKESLERHMKVNLCKTIMGLDWSQIISLFRYVPN